MIKAKRKMSSDELRAIEIIKKSAESFNVTDQDEKELKKALFGAENHNIEGFSLHFSDHPQNF